MKHFLFLLTLIVCFATTAASQTPESDTGEANVYLAKDDGKGKPGEPATEFSTTDTPIHCVVKLGDSAPVTVKMFLVAVNVSGMKPDLRIISASYTTSDGQNEVFFNGRPQKIWFSGTYRADIFVDEKPFRSLNFVVTAPKIVSKGPGSAPKTSLVKPRRQKSKININ